MLKRRFMHTLVAALVLVSMLVQGTWVLAGTTGGLSGTVTQTDTGAPIAGAKITVTSPSQSATTTTDNGGHFTFVSLAPDTYTLSVEKSGFEPAALAGVNVIADQTPSIAITTRASLRTIGRVTARSANDLVRPGTTSDVYAVSAAQQTAVQGLGGGGSMNQAYSAIASVPGVYVPQGQNGIYQSVYVRGGNYTELGYEFDGVPIQRAFDQYPSTALSSLGQQELQVYTGAAPADAQSNGLSGFVNQVIKTGTYPGFANLNLSLGTPTFYHKAQFEFGGATANRLFSYYVGIAGYNQQFRFGSQFNGAEYDPTFGTVYNVVVNNCGTRHATAGCGFIGGGYSNGAGILGLPLAPQGYTFGPFIYDFNGENDDRESVVNLHIGIPHRKDGGKDDIQLLYDNSWLLSPFQTSLNDWGNVSSNVLNGTALGANGQVIQHCQFTSSGLAFQPCALLSGYNTSPGAPGSININPFAYLDNTVYNGPMGQALNSGMLNKVANYYFPNSPQSRQPFAQISPTQRDTYDNRASIEKVQYQKNFGSSAFARIYGYSFYSDWLQNGADSLLQNFTGGVSPDYELVTHTRGVVASFVDQLNSKNLLNFTGGYTYASTVRWNNAFYDFWFSPTSQVNTAVLVSANHPQNGVCYSSTLPSSGTALTPVYCGSSSVAAYQLPPPAQSGLALAPNNPALALGSTGLASATCGGGPCQYYTVNNGMRGAYNTVAPAFSNLELSDTFKPSERLSINGGIRYDDFRYNLTDTNVPAGPEPQAVSAAPRVLWQNSYNLWHCVSAGSVISTSAPNNTASGACPTGYSPASVTVNSPGFNDYREWSPRVGATYTFSPLDVVRGSWGEYQQPASSAFQQYNNAGYNLPDLSPNTAFYPLGFFDPTHQVYPETSYNLDLSWEHQVKNSDMSWKLTPFLRKTRNELYTVLLDPKTAFVSAVNVGALTASGLEFLLRKGDFSRNGFAGQLAYTYTYASVKFGTLPSGGTVLDGVNQGIVNFNAYTQYCSTHPKAGPCSFNGVPGTITNALGNTVPAAPCYGSANSSAPYAPIACNKPNAIANPYWLANPFSQYDPGASYFAYNQLPGTGLSTVSSSYVIPHVATLLLNYKHDRFAIAPALQMEAGGRYGSPVEGQGVSPASCGSYLAAGGTFGDPRYPYGAAGGHPYNAASCGGFQTTPNWQTGQFDNFGAFVEPTVFSLSTQLTYEASNKVTLRLTAANLWIGCLQGGQHPWTQGLPYLAQSGCWYSTPASYIGNFYNPGDNVQTFVKNSYAPTFGNVFQSAYGGQANPFQLFLTAEMRL